MSGLEKYDAALLGILSAEGKIENFLDVLFCFLYRRTDFFRHLIFPKDNYGFRPGVAKKLVLNAFKKYESLAAEKNQKLKESYEKFLEDEKARMADEEEAELVVQEAVLEETVEATSSVGQTNESQDPGNDSTDPKPELECAKNLSEMETAAALGTREPGREEVEMEVSCAGGNENMQAASAAGTDAKESKKDGDRDKTGDEDTDEESELARAQKSYQSNPDSYNGAIRENYSWSQSISDLDIRVKVPEYIKKGKQVSVKVDKKHLKVSYANRQAGSEVVVVDDDLSWEVQREDAIWSLVPGEHVHISTEKVQERWWDALLTGESKISTRKIDASRPITDLGDEEQAKVEEMMFNERQKRLGLPQSHEMKTHDILRRAWDAEGSPFKGQPFDPSKLNISGSGF